MLLEIPLAIAIAFLFLSSDVISQRSQRDPSAPATRKNGTSLRVQLVDERSGKPIRNTDVEVYSDNGVRCVMEPCPTNGMSWNGRTDRNGFVRIPGSIRQRSMHISASGYSSWVDLDRRFRKTRSGVRIITLQAE